MFGQVLDPVLLLHGFTSYLFCICTVLCCALVLALLLALVAVKPAR
jgi:hypothetical protein